MKIQIRKTSNGIEFWDDELKKVVMTGGIDLGSGNSFINLYDMTVEQLHSYAERNNIEVPGNIKKKNSIIKYIEDMK